jgi:hypothetical protein
MDYMVWYERCLGLARLRENGGEMSEVEKSELEKSVGNGNGNSGDIYDDYVDILPA